MRGRWRITKLRSTRRLARRKGCWRPFPPYCGSLRWKGHRRAGFTDVDLTAVTEAISDAYRLDAEDADHQLVATIAEGVVVSGDQELLTQALANLVENALRHTPPGTYINVRLEGSSAAGALLLVEDDGPAVAGADLPRLTDRFYRGERSRTTPGNGLGLSLVNAVAELHGAELSLVATRPGLRVRLAFPVAKRPPPDT